MRFFSEPEPPRGRPTSVAPAIRRIVAGNAGRLTCHGTNTYIVEDQEGYIVVDPGPDDETHKRAVLEATADRLHTIVLTHRHHDHAAGAPHLKRLTGATLVAGPTSASDDLGIDQIVGEGERIGDLAVLHVPGHTPDHLCLATSEGVVFTGDHLMAWAPSAVVSPDGDAALYVAGLERLSRRGETLYLPGHGPPLVRPKRFIDMLIAMREQREQAIHDQVRALPGSKTRDVVDTLYAGLPIAGRIAATPHIEPYLWKLAATGRVVKIGGGWHPS